VEELIDEEATSALSETSEEDLRCTCGEGDAEGLAHCEGCAKFQKADDEEADDEDVPTRSDDEESGDGK
jgi:hypothetical protein